MKVDLNTLEKYIKEGLIRKQKHPEFNIWIYNYTQKCQFDRKWDNVTKMCRGLILDEKGNTIAKPFEKFFNYEEVNSVPLNKPFKIYKKMDGSLIIVCNYKGELIVATRGSFISDQAKLAERLLQDNLYLYNAIMSTKVLFTWLFELTGPDNRIVVNYNKNELTLLSVINNQSLVEIDLEEFKNYYFVKVVEEWKGDFNTISDLQNLNTQNEEGFVLKWENGYRLKVKFSDYVKLHRIITGLNEKTIWERLKNRKALSDLFQNIPEEFQIWCRNVHTNLLNEYSRIHDDCAYFIKDNNLRDLEKKEAALLILKNKKEYQSVLFSMIDYQENKIHNAICKLIKPSSNKTFKEDIDNRF